MKRDGESVLISATDLANHLSCPHLTELERRAAFGGPRRPSQDDAAVNALAARGDEHENRYLDLLASQGLGVLRLEKNSTYARNETLEAMRKGIDVIAQASLEHAPWWGRADVLLKTNTPSLLGDWSYEVIDTKLTRNTRAETMLQLCLYAEMLEQAQGILPERIGVVAPPTIRPGMSPEDRSLFQAEWYRTKDYMAYYRQAKRLLLESIEKPNPDSYPDPVEHCEVCAWAQVCRSVWRADDHLSLVAGITRAQRRDLVDRGCKTVRAVAEMDLEGFRPSRGSKASFHRTHDQARVQIEGRDTKRNVYELKPYIEPVVAEDAKGVVSQVLGFGRLPDPSSGDIFFDIEGAPFAGYRGLEYLFGVTLIGQSGEPEYVEKWAFDYEEEQKAFEWFVDLVEQRRQIWPDLHIYHYAPYEPSAIKRLVLWHDSQVEAVDDWLRNHLFVDLYRVVKESLIASVERYSIKDLEPFFGFNRDVVLKEAGDSRADLERLIETGSMTEVGGDVLRTVLGYNRDDCNATLALRDWLETLRAGQVEAGVQISRPVVAAGEEPKEESIEHRRALTERANRLLEGIPEDEQDRSPDQEARWLLAKCLGYYQREQKVESWEYFRITRLPLEEYDQERKALCQLTHFEVVDPAKRVHRYRFPAQECDIRDGDSLSAHGGGSVGTCKVLDRESQTIDIALGDDVDGQGFEAIYVIPEFFGQDQLEKSLMRFADTCLEDEDALTVPSPSTRFLCRRPPVLVDGSFQAPERSDSIVEDVASIVSRLDRSVLPIQGPPGSGKTYLGAHLVLDIVKRGGKVGITANSHDVVLNLANSIREESRKNNQELRIGLKVKSRNRDEVEIKQYTDNGRPLKDLEGHQIQVLGATKYLWCRPEFKDSVDVLVMDEASQMSLADTLAVAQAAKNLILIGDPRQLEKPQKGSHPEGVDVSPLDHLLDGELTIPPERGIFLSATRRLHPSITEFTSEVFYESKLSSLHGLETQALHDVGAYDDAGLHWVPVTHEGRTSSCPEEVDVIEKIVGALLERGRWTNKDGETRKLTKEDILIVAPYNAQVGDLQTRLPHISSGTVDKFQGKEAPVVIYSTTTSSPEDAPRGMEFLYSLNRLNVATSRAMGCVIVVGNLALLNVSCKTPRQVQLANALCRYKEMCR